MKKQFLSFWTRISSVLFTCFLHFLILLKNEKVLGARSTDELDSGYVIREETSHVIHHHMTNENYSHMSPINTIQARRNLTMEDMKLWGCYQVYSGSPLVVGSTDIPVPEVHPEVCMNQCKNAHQSYELVLIKGIVCTCTTWSSFNKKRIGFSYCNFECTGQGFRAEGEKIFCGGNLGFSVYCVKTEKGCLSSNLERIQNLESNNQPTTVAKNVDDDELIFDQPDGYLLECAECYNFLTGNQSRSCNRGNGFTMNQDYFPLNSPAECVKNCRRLDYPTGNLYPIAVLGWLSWPPHKFPICMCYRDNPLQSSTMEPPMIPANRSGCPTPCPGDNRQICGNYDNEQYYAVYCANSEFCGTADHDPIPTTDPTPYPETTPEIPNNSTQSTTVTQQSTEESTTIASTTSTTTEKTTTSTTATEETTTSSTATTTESTTQRPPDTTTSTTTIVTESPLSPPCNAVDIYGVHWIKSAGYLAEKNCNDNNYFHGKEGIAKWFCLNNGTFETPQPDYTDCKTNWHENLWNQFNNLSKNGTHLPIKESKDMLSKLEINCKPTDTNKVPYYGHEIKQISNLTWHIINTTKATLPEREALLKMAINTPVLLLENPTPWIEMKFQERLETAAQILHQMDETLFSLTKNINFSTNSYYNFTTFPSEFSSQDFLFTFGIRPKSTTKNTALTFPLDAISTDSFIQLSEGWEQVFDEPIFVGKSIDPKYIDKILPPTLTSFNKKRKPSDESVINGQLLSLTILKEAQSDETKMDLTNLKGKTVRITFQHQVEAWGKSRMDIPRKLHSGEIRKAAMESALCVFWNQDKKHWSSHGCRIIETTKAYTICECDHLTSFAVLMDLHNYVGKDFALEILTLLLCPLSTICLFISIVIFSTVGSIQNQRTTITKHLCICLMIGNILLLFFVDRNYFKLPQEVCIGVGIITHYVFLSAFVWMAIEGTLLYKMVVHVFDSGRTNTTIYRITAYGIPLLIVGITCVVGYLLGDDPYGGELYCWLEGTYIWGFIVPMALVVMGNIIILFVALKTAYQMKASTAIVQARQRTYKTWIRGSFSITVILGITWLPGFFVTASTNSSVAVVSGYIFVLLNASQGIFLFIFHCFMNEKVRSAAERNLSLPSWLSLPSSPKEFTQSGKRSENMRAFYSESSRSKQSGKDTMRGPPSRTNSANFSKLNGKKLSTGSNSSALGTDYSTPSLKKTNTETRGDKW